jgi:hypothetical protein
MKIKSSAIVLCITTLMFSSIIFAADAVLAKKTIDRWVDPVVMKGELASEVIGKPISNLRLYAYNNGTLEPIRYQIDEMTGNNGDYIFTSGKLLNTEMGNGKLDTWDVLTFMADDTGDRVSKDAWVAGASAGSEIEVIDPINNNKGWCYLLYFASNVPARSLKPDYMHFNYDTGVTWSDYRASKSIIKDGRHSVFTTGWWSPKGGGGNEKNFLDRVKSRITIKLLFGSLKLKITEESMKSDILAYQIGPIRMLKRSEEYFEGPKWIGGGKVARGIIDDVDYRTLSPMPVIIEIPFKLDTIASSVKVWVGVDYNRNVIGSKVFNSENPQGFLVDGKMDDGELNFNPAVDKWRIMTGPCQTAMQRTIFTPELLKEKIKIKFGIIDDETLKDLPESEPGTYGCIWQEWDITNVRAGKYVVFIEMYTIPSYKPGDEKDYMKYMDNPIKVRVGDNIRSNETVILPEVCKKYLRPPKD